MASLRLLHQVVVTASAAPLPITRNAAQTRPGWGRAGTKTRGACSWEWRCWLIEAGPGREPSSRDPEESRTHNVDPELRDLLLELRRRDERTRERLLASGRLREGYRGEMERVHLRNAAELEAALDRGGWPHQSQVGTDGSEAAWLVAQHAISRPDFQRRCLRGC